MFFVCNVWEWFRDLKKCCLYIFPDFERDLSRDVQIKCGKKSAAVLTDPVICAIFQNELQQIIACVPRRWWDGFYFERKVWLICCPLRQLSVLMLPTKCGQTRTEPCGLPRILSRKSTISVLQGKQLSVQTPQTHWFSSLIGFFGLDCVQSWRHSRRSWTLHLSSKRAASQNVLFPC